MIIITPAITDTLKPPKVAPGPAWSMRKLLHIDRNSRQARKRWRSHRLITPRKPNPLEPGRRSLTELSDELVLLMINHLQDVSPESVAVLAQVSTFVYGKARYVQHREESIDLSKTDQELMYLKYLADAGLLPAIRTIRFEWPGWPAEDSDSDWFPTPLNELVNRMTGLRDIYWGSGRSIIQYPLPISLVQNITQRSLVRLHASVLLDVVLGNSQKVLFEEHALQQISALAARQKTQPLTRRLKELLLSCPNLRKLSLDIHTPRGGCSREGLTDNYCGLGLSSGEKPPPLEDLEVVDYPWGHEKLPRMLSILSFCTIGYPEKGIEEDYWAQHCDWSQLSRHTLPNSLLAKKITQKLTALREVSFRHQHRFQNMNGWDERDTVQFLQDLPTALESISVPNLPTLGIGPIIRHGSHLRRLELIRSDHPYNHDWKESIVACKDLVRLRDGLPYLEELALDIATDEDDWCYKSLDILASFPRLRNLKLTIAVAIPEDEPPAGPYLTMASAEAIFHYMREHSSTGQPPPLQRLQVSSSCSFGQSDGPEQVTVSCTKLREELNERMRRIVRGEATATAEELGWVNFKIALDGPVSAAQLHLMVEADAHPFAVPRRESYTYLVDSCSF